MSEFSILGAAAAGMDAQRSALDLAARNVAAASATEGDGRFERLVPRFERAADPEDAGPGAYEPGEPDDSDDTESDHTELPIRYLGATAQRSDVDAVTEMVSVLGAQRAYEANASIFDLGKRMAERTIDLGRLS